MPTGVHNHKPCSKETKRKIGLANSLPKRELTCHCGAKVLVNPARRLAKFCSYDCMGVASRGRPAWNKGTKGLIKPNKGSFQKGIVPWSKGKHIKSNNKLQEYREKFGAWNRGKSVPQIRGEKHWNWQGGKSKERERIQRSLEYKAWRITVFERDNYTCVFCGERGGKLNADHIKPFSTYPSSRLDVS